MSKNKADALLWLYEQSNKAFNHKNKKEIQTLRFLIAEMEKPDYEKELKQIDTYLQKFFSINLGRFRRMVTNPKPKTITVKPLK